MRALALALVALGAVAPAAQGGTVGPSAATVNDLVFTAAPGEQNDLTVTVAGDGIHFRDTGYPVVSLGPPCEPVSRNEVVCRGTLDSFSYRKAELGDGDDRVRAEGVYVFLGPGNDVATADMAISGAEGDDDLTGSSLDGGPGNDVLRGTPGPDRLDAGQGRDEVRAGDGDDLLYDGGFPGETDLLDGGAGTDGVDYGFRADPILIDLPRDVGGGQGEDDRLPGVESGTTGAGADLLVGDDGDNQLAAGEGDDVVRAGAGADALYGAGGSDHMEGSDGDDTLSGDIDADVLDGGAGDDRVDGGGFRDMVFGGEGADTVSGGSGADTVDAGPGDDAIESEWDQFLDQIRCGDGLDRGTADAADALDADCEAVTRRPASPFLASVYPARGGRTVLEVRGRTLAVAVPCPDHCLGRFVLRVGGRVAVRTTWRCADDYRGRCVAHEPPSLTARLPRRLVRRLLRGGRLRGRVTMTLLPGGIPQRTPVLLVPRRG